MDTVIVKDGNLYIACSLSPVGVFGWGENEKRAKEEIEENLYDYCNWLSKPLPKDMQIKVASRYNGNLGEITFKEDDGVNTKKYSEIVLQSAFSFKVLEQKIIGHEKEEQVAKNLYLSFGLKENEGIIGYATEICESGSLKNMRNFCYKIYRSVKEITELSMLRGEDKYSLLFGVR